MWRLKALFLYTEKVIDFTILLCDCILFSLFKRLTAVLSFRVIKDCAYKIYSNYLGTCV